jgi:hypothetical protein
MRTSTCVLVSAVLIGTTLLLVGLGMLSIASSGLSG